MVLIVKKTTAHIYFMLFTNCNVQPENKLRFLGKEAASDVGVRFLVVLSHSVCVCTCLWRRRSCLPGGGREGSEGQGMADRGPRRQGWAVSLEGGVPAPGLSGSRAHHLSAINEQA